MSLRRAVAAPFRGRGTDELPESEYVVALSLDRDWFSPDQAKRLIDVASGEGLLERADGGGALRPTFDPAAVEIPEDFRPDESVLARRSTFERALSALVDDGVAKQDAVAAINRRQADLGLTIEAAAVLEVHSRGLDVGALAAAAREEIADG